MAKAAGKAKANSGFTKPMQPSEHLAKIVGTDMFQMTKAVNKHLK